MNYVGPFTYNAVRFALGSLSLVPLILFRARRGCAPIAPTASAPRRIGALPAGLIAGGILFFGASLQQIGIVHTTAGKAGFITGLYVVLVPLSGLFWRQRAGWSAWVGALLSVAGLFLLSMTDALTIEPSSSALRACSPPWAAWSSSGRASRRAAPWDAPSCSPACSPPRRRLY
jgi:drug/metabolite transporter (DMT)-like permease